MLCCGHLDREFNIFVYINFHLNFKLVMNITVLLVERVLAIECVLISNNTILMVGFEIKIRTKC